MRGQLRQRIGLGGVDGSLTLNGEVDPAVATWALARKANVAPPSAHQRVMNRTTKSFETEVDSLQMLLAA